MKLKHLEVIIKKMKYYPLFGLYFLSKFIKRNKNLWVFGTYNASFGDNSKYLYLYLEKNYPEIEIVWITRKKSNLKILKDKGINAYYKKSLKGISYILKARFIFSNTNIEDVSFWFSNGAVFINLWHGVPLKKIEFDIKKGKIAWKYQSSNRFMYLLKKLSFPGLYRQPDFLLVPSKYVKKFMKSAFKIEEKNLILCEYPRNSIFRYSKKELLQLIEHFESKEVCQLIVGIEKYDKTFIYLPTFRDGKKDFLKDSGINFELLNDVAEKNKYLFLIKLHPTTDVANVKVKSYSNIRFFNSAVDIYPILPFTDVLISDYSSIFFDYLLLDKEILFFPFDIEEYMSKSREIYFNYNEVTPGRKCYTFTELLHAVKNISNIDFSKEREKIKLNIWEANNHKLPELVSFLMNK